MAEQPERLLIYHIGSLGDTLMAVPALWLLREIFPDAHRTLLTKQTPRKESVLAHELFQGTDMFHDILFYSGERYQDRRLKRFMDWFLLAARIRSGRFTTAVYLAPSDRSPEQTERDRKFFRFCGIPRLIGFAWTAPESMRSRKHPLPGLPTEAELLLTRLTAPQIPARKVDALRRDLDLKPEDFSRLDEWLDTQTPSLSRLLVAFAVGSNMSAKQWPEERFLALGNELISHADIWPIVFGGTEDKNLGDRLITGWGRGYNAAGTLDLRTAAAAMQSCSLFIGNDTGTMHLAASEGVRCVAIFSARDFPGKWYPLGADHVIIRRSIQCEGCMLETCSHNNTQCILDISVKEVLEAALPLLGIKTNDSFK